MLPVQNRLKKKKDFDVVFRKGRSFREDFLSIKIIPNDLEFSRFGLVVGQKVSKKAVSRNKVKRRLREAIRMELPNIKKGVDVILMTSPEIAGKDFLEIEKRIKEIFIKAKILNYQ